MLGIRILRTNASLDYEKSVKFALSLVQAGFYPVTLGTLIALAKKLEPEPGYGTIQMLQSQNTPRARRFDEPVLTELFLSEDPCVFHLDVSRSRITSAEAADRKRVQITCVFAEASQPPEAVDKFVTAATEYLHQLDKETQLVPAAPIADPEKLATLPGLDRPPPPSQSEIRAATILSEKQVRDTVVDCKTSLVRINTLLGQGGKPPSLTRERLRELIRAGLIGREYAAYCKGTGEVVVSETHKAKVLRSGATCRRCLKPIRDHDVYDIAVPAPLAQKLLVKSRWMTILAVKTLVEEGVPVEHIRTPPSDSGSDVIDLAFVFDYNLYVCELKDREFDWGDASHFGTRVRQIEEADYGVVATTGGASSDAKGTLSEVFTGPRDDSPFVRGRRKFYEILEGPGCVTDGLRAFLRQQRLLTASVEMSLAGAGSGLDVYWILWLKFREVLSAA